jgi:hypothetical protein
MSSGAQNMKKGPDDLGTAEKEVGKNGPDALDTAKNMSESGKHENRIGHPRYRRKRVRERKTSKRDPTPSVWPKTILGAQNMKTVPDALDTA